MQNKKVTKVLGKHKKLILDATTRKILPEAKRKQKSFHFRWQPEKLLLFFILVHCLPTDRKYNSADRTEIFSNFFPQFRFYYQNAMHYEFRFFFNSSTSPVIRLDLLFIFYFVANFYTFCMIQWKIKIKNF